MTSSPNDPDAATPPNTPNAPDAPDAPADADAPAPEAPTPAIVLGHGGFAEGLTTAVAAITGRGDLLIPISNHDAGLEEIERRIAEAIERYGARIVFTDLPAGSCTFAARRLLRTRPEITLVTGTSLAALIDYVFHAELPPGDAAEHAAEMARKAVSIVRAPAPPAGAAATGGERAG